MKTYLKWTLIIAGLFFVFAVYKSEKARLDSVQQSALDNELFCKKSESEKRKIIAVTIDSLRNTDGQIIKNYFLLVQLENEVNTFEKRLFLDFPDDRAQSDDVICRAMLKALATMDAEKYLKSGNNGHIKSFIPILNFDKVGKIKSIIAEIKYSNGKIDTVTDNTITDFQSLVNELKFDKSKRERDNRVRAQKIELEKKQREEERIQKLEDKKRERKRLESERAQELENKREIERRIREMEANSIKATNLHSAFNANEVAANKRYLNKVITIDGIIESVAVEFGKNVIHLYGDNRIIHGVSCIMNGQEEIIERLRPGQRIFIQGKCKGVLLSFVTLENCEIAF